MKASIIRRIVRLEELVPAPPQKPLFQYAKMSDQLLEAIMDAEGEIDLLSDVQIAELETALVDAGPAE